MDTNQGQESGVSSSDKDLGYIKLVLVITVGIILAAWIMYASNVGWSISSSSEKWSHFGGFFAGLGSTLAPILSAASILFVWYSSKSSEKLMQEQLNSLQAALATEEVKSNTLIQQLTVSEQTQKSMLKAQISSIYTDGIRRIKNSANEHPQAFEEYGLSAVMAGSVTVRNCINQHTDFSTENLRSTWPIYGSFVTNCFELLFELLAVEKYKGVIEFPNYHLQLLSELNVIELKSRKLLVEYSKIEPYCMYPTVTEFLKKFDEGERPD